MKKISYFSAFAVFALAMSGCSKDAAENTASPQGVQVSFRGEYAPAANASAESRASVDPTTGKTSWVAGDQCGVWVVENSVANVPFANTAEHPMVFTGMLDTGITSAESVWAYYPYSADATLGSSPREMLIPVPYAQIQKGGVLGAYSVLTAAGTLSKDAENNPQISSMQFIHQTAGLCFNVYGSLRAASTNSETLVSVSFTAGNIPAGITVSDPAVVSTAFSASTGKTMTVTLENTPSTIGYAKADGTKAFLSVICNPYQITSITVTTDQATYTKDFTALSGGGKSISPTAGKVYPINLDLGTFSVAKKFSLGVPGTHNSWSTANGITGRTAGFYSGMVPFAGTYKYYKDGAWYGQGGEPNTLYYLLSKDGGSEFDITGNYYVVADLTGNNASLVNFVSAPGTANSWDLTAPAFTYDTARDLWVASGVAMTAGAEFKVVFNKTWQANMNRTIVGGGTIQPGTPVRLGYDAGRNITVGTTGTYNLLLDLSTYGGTLVLEPVAVP